MAISRAKMVEDDDEVQTSITAGLRRICPLQWPSSHQPSGKLGATLIGQGPRLNVEH